MMDRLVFFTSIFMIIFGWKYGEIFDLILVTSAVWILVYMLRQRTLSLFNIFISSILGAICLYSLFISVVNGGFEVDYFMRGFRAFINYLGCFAIAFFMAQKIPNWKHEILNNIFLSIALHSGISFMMFFNDGLREFIYSHIGTFNIVNNNASILLGYRIPGLTYGLSQTSLVHAIGLLIFFELFHNLSMRQRFIYVLLFILIFASIFIIGRSGLALLVVLIPVYLYIKAMHSAANFKPIFTTMIYAVLISGGAVLLLNAFPTLLPEKFFSYNVERSKEVITFFSQSDGESPIDIKSMLFLPDNAQQLLFGDSATGRGALGYLRSDAGITKLIFGLGLVGTSLYYLVYCYMLYIAFKRRSPYSALIFVVLLSCVLLNFKELALMTRNQFSIHLLLFSLYYFDSVRQNATQRAPQVSARTYPTGGLPE